MRRLILSAVLTLLCVGAARAKGEPYIQTPSDFTTVHSDSLVRFFNKQAVEASAVTTNPTLAEPVYNLSFLNVSGGNAATVRLYGPNAPAWASSSYNQTTATTMKLVDAGTTNYAIVVVPENGTLTLTNLQSPVYGFYIRSWSGGVLRVTAWNSASP